MSSLSGKFQSFSATLQNIYPRQESDEITSIVFEEILQLNRIALRMDKDRKLSGGDLQVIDLILERLMKHEPLQYVLGYTWFCKNKYLVNRHVLIPRRETEELVDWICNEHQGGNALRILDIGTGSGCIAIEIKQRLEEAEVWGIDISKDALNTARINAEEILGAQRVNWSCVNIIDPSASDVEGTFDLIVSNPPYVTYAEQTAMRNNVIQYEPHSALFVDDQHPLRFYEAIADFALIHLRVNGSLYFEINETQGFNLTRMLKAKGYSNIIVKKDMQGKDRMMRAGK